VLSKTDEQDSCNTPTLVDYLADRGLTAYGQTGPVDSLTNRNADRVRILKHIANNPEGVQQTALCHEVLKGADPTSYAGYHDLSGDALDRYDAWCDRFYNGSERIALDGSDDDYQFLNRFINDVEESTDLVRTEAISDDDTRGRWVYPTLSMLDLISAGITQTPTEPNRMVFDKEFLFEPPENDPLKPS